MEKRMILGISTIIFLVTLTAVHAHGDAGQEYFENIWFYLAPFIAIVFGAILVHYYETHPRKILSLDKVKKVIFFIIVLVTAYVSLTIFYQTIQINVTSWTKGPVHWHADVEIEICGQPYFLPTAEGLSNKVGENLVHTHEDMRIHVEGPVMEPADASLGTFFQTQGIPFSQTQIADKKNGDLCPDGRPGKVRMYVNGMESIAFEKHIIAPYPDVPPGDFIKITFGAD